MADEKYKVLEKVFPDALVKTAKERLEHCESCDKLEPVKRKCLMCGCFMDFKVYLPGAKCPLKKW